MLCSEMVPPKAALPNEPAVGYPLKHRIVSWVSSRVFDRMTYTQRHGLIAGMRRRGGLGWLPFSEPESEELRFWRQLDLRGKVVYDIGAFQGLLTLHFARHAQCVVAYEPSPETRGRLKENVTLNRLRNVIVRPVGIADTYGDVELVAAPLIPGAATLNTEAFRRTSRHANLRIEKVSVTTLDQDVAACNLPAPDLLKIDIEGMEAAALRGAKHTITTHRPDLFLEMHGETMSIKRANVAGIVSLLGGYGYGRIKHIESGEIITPDNSAAAAEGHLFASVRHQQDPDASCLI